MSGRRSPESERFTDTMLLALKMEEGPTTTNAGSLECERGKATDSSLENL